MKIFFLKLWDQYVRYYNDRYPLPDIYREEMLSFLRDKLFITILLLSFPICIIAYIPSVIVSIITQQFVIVVFDTAALVLFSLFFFSRKIPLIAKKIYYSVTFYVLSSILIFYLGNKGPGIIILICSSVLVTLFQSKRAGLIAILLNSIIYLIFLIIVPLTSLAVPFVLSDFSLAPGIAIGLNLIAFNTLVVLSASSLVDQLHNSFLKERQLQLLYRQSEQEIKNLNLNLEQKIEERTAELADINDQLLNEIEEHKKTEADLRIAKSEAENANRAKSDFLAGMSHEIRTPMNAILGYSQLLGFTLKEKLQQDYIESIKSSGKTLLTIINDILDLSKIEAGRLSLQPAHVDTALFFNDFERIFAFRISEKKLKYTTHISRTTPATLYFDSVRMRQVLLNLVGNAVKFTETGEIIIKVHAENPRSIVKSDIKSQGIVDLVIEVKDTGIGIPEEYHRKIFDSFVQVQSKSAHYGTGLGLTITHRLIQMMNGSVDLTSVPGTGSTFTVRIPEIKFETISYKKPEETVFNPKEVIFEKATILIVDDVDDNRFYLSAVLEDTELTIIEASDGYEALKALENKIPDLAIVDILMPGMDGFELLSKIKEKSEFKHIPVIAYSASVMKEQRQKILQSNFSGLLVKPVQIKEIYAELMNHLKYHMREKPGLQVSEIIEYDRDEINDLPELLSELQGKLSETCKKLELRQPIGEVIDFGKQLIALGIKHNCSLILDYGNELTDAADSFNVESMLKLLKGYREKVDFLKL